MGTRARVGIELDDGVILSAYVHYDGYFAGLGKTLVDHYSDEDTLFKAIALGDASYWAERHVPLGEHSFDKPEKGTTVYYGRDRGETGTAPVKSKDIDAFIADIGDAGEEYGYVFTLDGLWVAYDRARRVTTYDAEQVIIDAYEKLDAA